MKSLVSLSLAMICAAVTPASAGSAEAPMLLGGNPRFEPCMSIGVIVGLDPKGDGFLSVRTGPGGRAYAEKDRLYNGDKVYVCGYQTMPWYPVIYDRTGRRICPLPPPSAQPAVYRGPCPSGWIHSRYVRIIAG